MGERGQIFIKSTGVYIYTHWGGAELLQVVHRAMQWGRVEDDEYFTRALVEELVRDDQFSDTGSGVGTKMHSDLNWPLVTVDTVNNVVELEGKNSWTFEEFKKLSDIEAVAAQVLEVE